MLQEQPHKILETWERQFRQAIKQWLKLCKIETDSSEHMIAETVSPSLVVGELPAGDGGLERGLQLPRSRRRVVDAVVRAEPRLLQGGGHGRRGGRGRGGGGGAEEAAPRRGGGARPPALLLPERGVLQRVQY